MARISLRTLLGGAAIALLATTAGAEPPAAIHRGPDLHAEESFERFAQEWMDEVHRLEAAARRKPTVRRGARDPVVTYHGYGDDFSTELRPTGHPDAPYVGILRYTEKLFTCTDLEATDCTVASSVPVTEIFRYQNGRWAY